MKNTKTKEMEEGEKLAHCVSCNLHNSNSSIEGNNGNDNNSNYNTKKNSGSLLHEHGSEHYPRDEDKSCTHAGNKLEPELELELRCGNVTDPDEDFEPSETRQIEQLLFGGAKPDSNKMNSNSRVSLLFGVQPQPQPQYEQRELVL